MTKQIQINQQDFNTIETVFWEYIQNNPEQMSDALKTMQKIIDQCID